jgi:hypothetical protein
MVAPGFGARGPGDSLTHRRNDGDAPWGWAWCGIGGLTDGGTVAVLN